MKNPQIMLVFRLVLAVFIICFGANSILKAHRLGQDGVVTQAVITFVSTGKPAYQYRFLAKDQYFFGFVHDRHVMGETLDVRYLPDNPSVNKAVVSSDLDPGWFFFGFGLIWTGFSVFLFLRGGHVTNRS